MSLVTDFFFYTGVLFWAVLILFGGSWLFCNAIAKAELRRRARLTPPNPQ